MNKKMLVAILAMVAFAVVGSFAVAQDNTEAKSAVAVEAEAPAEAKADNGDIVGAIKYLAAALAVGVACIGGAMAVGKIGAAAMGAMSENAELSGKALPFLGLAEGICLWGFIVAFLIIFM